MQGSRKAIARSQRGPISGQLIRRTDSGGAPGFAQGNGSACKPAAPKPSPLFRSDLRPPDARTSEHHNGVSGVFKVESSDPVSCSTIAVTACVYGCTNRRENTVMLRTTEESASSRSQYPPLGDPRRRCLQVVHDTISNLTYTTVSWRTRWFNRRFVQLQLNKLYPCFYTTSGAVLPARTAIDVELSRSGRM